MNWYCFDQNNSGGSFVVNDKVCHRLFIEANTPEEAISKAEDLGCYWDGVAHGMDCPCCGDRWSCYYLNPVDIEKYKTKGYSVNIYDGIYHSTKGEWERRYRRYKVIKEPEFRTQYSMRDYVGTIAFDNIEEYAQYLADEHGWTTPDARIYYDNGCVKEIFSKNPRE